MHAACIHIFTYTQVKIKIFRKLTNKMFPKVKNLTNNEHGPEVPAVRIVRQENQEFPGSLSYKVRLTHKKKKYTQITVQ